MTWARPTHNWEECSKTVFGIKDYTLPNQVIRVGSENGVNKLIEKTRRRSSEKFYAISYLFLHKPKLIETHNEGHFFLLMLLVTN